MLVCRNAEGVHVQRKVGNPWLIQHGSGIEHVSFILYGSNQLSMTQTYHFQSTQAMSMCQPKVWLCGN